MSPRTWQASIQDILDAIGQIYNFMDHMDYETFRQDIKTVRAVELNLIIIGEAANMVPNEIQEKHPEVPWHFMRAMRNRLVHVYFDVDPKLVWDTVNNDLPPLVISLESLIS
jgi:uncharacterized protein with HEPN domain